jgi:hypothetical protein
MRNVSGAFPPWKWVILGALFCMVSAGSEAATYAYRLKVGATYFFDVLIKGQGEWQAFDLKKHTPIEAKAVVEVHVLAFRNDLYVLDIATDGTRVRRYMKPDGSIFMAPGEKTADAPFFITLPVGDIADGKTYTLPFSAPAGKTVIQGKWDVTVSDVDAGRERKRFKILGTVALPSDRVVKRALTAKGEVALNTSFGCLEAGELTTEYQCDVANKEIAVIRPMWTIRETRKVSFKLREVK